MPITIEVADLQDVLNEVVYCLDNHLVVEEDLETAAAGIEEILEDVVITVEDKTFVVQEVY